MKNTTNSSNTTNNNSFVDSFNNILPNLAIRYDINMHLDFIQEFIKYADNTRDSYLLGLISAVIHDAQGQILEIIKRYENERDNKENVD